MNDTQSKTAGSEVQKSAEFTSIDEMCAILAKHLIKADEYTDCAIVYKVTFDQLRSLYDLGRATLSHPATQAGALQAVEPMRFDSSSVLSDRALVRLWDAMPGEDVGQWERALAFVHLVREADAKLAATQPNAACEHEWVSARNKVVTSGEICAKLCGAIRSEQPNAAPAAEVVAETLLRDLTQLASEYGDHTPESFRRGVMALSTRAHKVLRDAGRARALAAPAAAIDAREQFQQRVKPWLLECFGEQIAADREERNHRFLEEALELVQACGCTASEAHQLVDYTFGRPVGEKTQEVGGVMVTLAALCLAHGIDMHAEGETELTRISVPAIVAKIRAKQAAKPKHSPLPEEVPAARPNAAGQEQGEVETPRCETCDGTGRVVETVDVDVPSHPHHCRGGSYEVWASCPDCEEGK